jgi:hypothetical protein
VDNFTQKRHLQLTKNKFKGRNVGASATANDLEWSDRDRPYQWTPADKHHAPRCRYGKQHFAGSGTARIRHSKRFGQTTGTSQSVTA